MRTITDKFYNRLQAQADEADTLGMEKLSERLTNIIVKNADNIRSDSAFYSYNERELRGDVEDALWSAVVRIADFHDCQLDAKEIQASVFEFSKDFITTIRNKIGAIDGVGAYESNVPGEERAHVVMEVELNE